MKQLKDLGDLEFAQLLRDEERVESMEKNGWEDVREELKVLRKEMNKK